MLRPEQISNARFTPVSAGSYSSDEVDAFLAVVAQAYQELLDDKNDLVKKISILAEKVEKYRKDEDAIKAALLDAHKMADNLNKSSNEKASAVITEAENKAKEIGAEAERQANEFTNSARTQAADIVTNARNAVASIKERAQQEADTTISGAKTQAANIVSSANRQGESIIGDSKKQYEFYTTELRKVKSEFEKFRTMVEMLYSGEMKPEEIKAIPAEPVIPEFTAPVAEPEAAPAVPAVEPAPAPEPEIPATPVYEEEAAEDDDDLFGDLSDDADADFAADIDSIVPETVSEPEAPAAQDIPSEPEVPAAPEPQIPNSAESDDDIDESFFAELGINPSDIDFDDSDDDEDLNSLFDSLFD